MLTRNAFYILGVTPRDGKETIAEAFEECLSKSDHDENDLMQAQKALMASKARLEEESSWFPDLSPKKSQSLITAFVGDKIAIDKKFSTKLHDALSELSGISKANLAAYVCHRKIADLEVIAALFECQSEITVSSLKSLINANRKVSGFPEVTNELLSDALQKRKKFWAEAIIDQLSQLDHPGKRMADFVSQFINSDLNTKHFLEDVLSNYDSWAIPSLRNFEDEINELIDNTRASKGNKAKNVEQIIENLKSWVEYAQPSQILYSSKGLDEPRSKKIFEQVRDLGLWLANEQSEYQVSLLLSQAAKQIFSELPSVSNRLEEDIDTLKGLVDQAKAFKDVAPLAALIEQYTKDDLPLLEVLNKVPAFEKLATDPSKTHKYWHTGRLGELYEAFLEACKRAAGTDHSNSPWYLMRNLALHLNNDGDSPEAAKKLIEKLNSLSPPTDVQIFLAKDLKTMHGNCLVRELKRLPSGSQRKAIKIIEQIILIADEEDKKGWIEALNKLKGQQRASSAKAIVWLVIIVGGYGLSQCDDKSSRSNSHYNQNYSSTRSYSSNPAPAYDDKSEVKPSYGMQNQTLTTGNLRWCLYQKRRLDFINNQFPASQYDTDQTARYNISLMTKYISDQNDNLISEFNSRCVNTKYLVSSENIVNQELNDPAVQQKITNEAKQIMLNWNSGFLFKE